ncbi:MAG: YqhA family protein [Coriobacteriales bacterium]|jgi:uncharacterized protein (TIGR00645 family)|nr:YqhA family protein [Coriobacteriales bacterium]
MGTQGTEENTQEPTQAPAETPAVEERPGKMERFREFLEDTTERTIFASRWILAPIFLGLCVGLLAVAVNFLIKLVGYIPKFPFMTIDDMASSILSLIDLALLGNLLLIVVFSGYENFVSKINPAQDHEDRPEWMGTLDFSGLKIKILGSVVAISLVELLQDFINMSEHGTVDPTFETWRIALHLTFVLSGTLFAVMDYIAEKRQHMMQPGGQKQKSSTKPEANEDEQDH